jgi:hypothetical protein
LNISHNGHRAKQFPVSQCVHLKVFVNQDPNSLYLSRSIKGGGGGGGGGREGREGGGEGGGEEGGGEEEEKARDYAFILIIRRNAEYSGTDMLFYIV